MQPSQQVRQAPVDIVDVERCDFHGQTGEPDYDKYCTGTMPGGGRIIACLNKQYGQLADACKKVIDVQKKQ
ncbi:MAG TPA: hypothetical protein VIJ35_21080 [Bradyrhizobium sp.]